MDNINQTNENTTKTKKKVKCKKNNSKKNNNNTNNNYLNLKLEQFSYADYIILASSLAYAVGDELSDSDLDLLIIFMGMISSDLALIRTKRGIVNRKQTQNATNTVDIQSTDIASGNAELNFGRTSKNKKKKYIKRKKVRIKK
ncbi:MAG: hypothetical protein RRZ84_04440 [Romboutsia sp.]